MAKKEDLKTASVLAFERKLDPSDALFHAGNWSKRDNYTDWSAIIIREKSVRGTASHRLKDKKGEGDTLKRDMKVDVPNPQLIDVATLPSDADTLKVSFTLRVLNGTGEPSACNDEDYRNKLVATVHGYTETNGFGELARRYAFNLANGRFLWRNRIGAESIEVQVAHLVDGAAKDVWTFDALSLPLRSFEAPTEASEKLDTLSKLIAGGLSGTQHVLLGITAFVRMGAGQEVFPSQELILDRGRGDKSKTLYSIGPKGHEIAALHSQKIGNALRTIDTWYEGADELGPIAVEPYGSVTTLGKAYRQPKDKKDFYNLLDNWILKDRVPELEQQHFVIATLVRGGVFGEAG